YPTKFKTDVRTSCAELWENNPHIQRLEEGDPEVEVIHCSYPLINRSNEEPYHCIHGYIQFLNQRLGLGIRPTAFRGDIHLSALEKSWYSQVHELTRKDIPFWIVAAGGKFDVTVKWWDVRRYQAVIDHFRGKIQFVQVGEYGHYHPRLRGVIDLRGQTNLRELVRLVYHAQGVLCPVTALMHLSAAVEFKHNPEANRPCVVVAGAREPAHWEAYPDHQFIQTNGALRCCTGRGCWKDRTLPLGDGDPRDQKEHLCLDVVDNLPRCMSMISPEEVIRRIEMYFDGGVIEYLKAAQRKAARRAIQATRNNDYDNQPLNLHTAPAACERFIETVPPYPRGFEGRGIVICGGGLRYFPSAWVCINMLRHLGCTLPIELWHLGAEEMDREMIALLKPLRVDCIDALEVCKRFPVRILNGWELKPYAILRSRFREVLLLDADNMPVLNPEFLFECDAYRRTGALFWPDYSQFKKTQVIWDNCGLRRPDGPEFESGQIVVDKERSWKALCLAMWFNEQSDFYYQYLHGDKETFHLAFCKLGMNFAMPSTAIQRLEGTMCQHDFDGRRVFQHRNTDKWNLFIANRRVPGFRYDAECRSFLLKLQQAWDGHASRYVKQPGRRQLREPGTIRLGLCMISCPEREKIRERTLLSLKRSDWGNRPVHVEIDRREAPRGGRIILNCDSSVAAGERQRNQAHTAWRALRHVLRRTDAEYILFLEDDVEVNRFMFHNLQLWRPLLEGEVTLAGLYNPGLRAAACDVKRQALIVDAE
ncbi:MAG TPA: glycosyltransferase family 9 protein, partial [Patescibacteria group bacterium]|nr:glycosyltransferase family 9 protein [Patescibacteria group bacterium]